ncbi:MAG: single-stranded DNA-binding protein [Bacteroidales bacterium]|jgi:single-strand DNA-binding protein
MNTNTVILVGNLVRDPEMRYTPGGHAVANFTVAVNDGFGDKQDTDFIDCTIWRKTAEAVTNYCQKGSKVLVQGKLKQQAWKDREGNNRKRVYVKAQRIEFLNTKAIPAKMEPEYEEPGGGYAMDSNAFVEGDAPF